MRGPVACNLVLVLLLLVVGSPVWAQDDVAEILASRPDEALSTESGIVCLLNQVWYDLIPAGVEGETDALQRITQRSRILAFPGPHYGSISWAPVSGATLSLVFARVIHTDGSVTDLEPNETAPRLPVFSVAPDGSPRLLDFGSLSPGDVLEYEIVQESAFPAQFFWMEYPFSEYWIPVLRSEIEVTVPEGQSLTWNVNGADASSVSVETSESGRWLRAVIDEIPVWNLDYVERLQFTQQDVPSIVISSVPSWQVLADCLDETLAPASEARNVIEGLSIGLSYGSSSIGEAIDRMASFASDFANGGAGVWREPDSDALGTALISVGGSAMLTAMLEQAGISAYLAFASSSVLEPFAFDAIPALPLCADRRLTAIPNTDGSLQFIDPLLGSLWRMTETIYEGHDLWVLDGSNDGQGQIVHIPRSTADENTVHWDLRAVMPSECRLEVVGTITATGKPAFEWSYRLAEGDSDSETLASLWPGEPAIWSESQRYGADSWIESLRVVSVEIGDPFVAEIAFERDFSNFGCFVDLTYFPGIETDISRLASVSAYACEGLQAFSHAYPMTWSSDIVVTPPSGYGLEISADHELSHGPVRYDLANVWDGERLVVSRSMTIASEIDETSCEGLSDIVTEIIADDLGAWFRFLP